MPAASSDPPENRPGKPIVFIRSCFGWGLHGFPRYRRNGSLLHCLSTLTGLHTACRMQSEEPAQPFLPFGGLFLLHWPWSHLHRTLSGILPCEARTFLTHISGRDYLSYLFTFYSVLKRPFPLPNTTTIAKDSHLCLLYTMEAQLEKKKIPVRTNFRGNPFRYT